MFFTEALQDGTMESYFRLAEQYTTQKHPAFCGIGSLTMALNALLVDPQRVWQGVWRWYDDSMLDCCEPLDIVKAKGITMAKLACLARCNGTKAVVKSGSEMTVEEFRSIVSCCCSRDIDCVDGCVIIVSYSRAVLNQTGSGHFSPIAGYHKEKDMVLIMDVARFKYPPHWVPLATLHSAMNTIDSETGQSRGCLLLSPSRELREMFHCDKGLCASCDSGVLSSEPPIMPPPSGASNNVSTPDILQQELSPYALSLESDVASMHSDEVTRSRSNTGAVIGQLFGVTDGTVEELRKDNPITTLCKHRCRFCAT